jgi:hypothetical protein
MIYSNKELIRTIIIPAYPRKVLMSKSRRAKYFIQGKDTAVKDKKKYWGNRYIWKEYVSASKKKEIRLFDVSTNEYVIKNSRIAGTEKWLVINGQKYYSGLYQDYEKGKILDAINAHYYSFLQGQEPIVNYPLYIECEIHDLAVDPISGNMKWDVFNRAFPYCKAFEDNLKKHNIIPDDNTDYVLVPSHGIFVPIRQDQTPFLQFNIYKINL